MYCPHCGSQAPDGALYCDNCGGQLSNEPPVTPVITNSEAPASGESVRTYVAPPQPLTKREFLKLEENKKLKSGISSAAIICYISAVLTLGVSMIGGGLNIIDPICLLVLGLFIQIGYSIIAAIILLAYSIINMIIMISQTGRMSGYLIVLAGFYAVYYTFQAASKYRKYKKELKQ